jgi:cytochrome c5
VSKQDTHFFNMFSLVLGILVGIAVLIFVFAKITGSRTQVEHLKTDPLNVAAVQTRVEPFAKVAIAGQDTAALAIKAPASASATPAAAMPTDGEGVFKAACIACHGAGIAGAPKFGDKAAWAPRIAKGMDTLHQHSIKGFQGQAGVMPPKGGRMDISDELIQKAVDYMVNGSR